MQNSRTLSFIHSTGIWNYRRAADGNLCICREQVSATCQCIAVSAFTGEIGDGKIFVSPVSDIIRMCEFYYSSVYGAMLSSYPEQMPGMLLLSLTTCIKVLDACMKAWVTDKPTNYMYL